MMQIDLERAMIDLLYELNSRSILDIHLIDVMSKIFSLDVLELCEQEGITYLME